MDHDLYKTGDADAPTTICDANGEVVLGQCRVCGKAEAELIDAEGCDPPVQNESQGYAIEALWQLVPEVKPRDDNWVVLTPAQLEKLLRAMGWRAPCDQRNGISDAERAIREQEYAATRGIGKPMPDFDAIRDKRLSEMAPEQREDAHELWLREQVGVDARVPPEPLQVPAQASRRGAAGHDPARDVLGFHRVRRHRSRPRLGELSGPPPHRRRQGQPDVPRGVHQPVGRVRRADGARLGELEAMTTDLTKSEREQIAEILTRRANEVAGFCDEYRRKPEHHGSVELALTREIVRLRRLAERVDPPTEDEPE